MKEISSIDFFKNLPEEELSPGHEKRFLSKLNNALPVEQRLWNIQRVLIAASAAAMIAGILLSLIFYSRILYSNTLLANSPGEFYETEIFMQNEIKTKMKQLTGTDNKVMDDFEIKEKSFTEIREDLQKNPNDIRLITAVLQTYQAHIDILDEMLEQQN